MGTEFPLNKSNSAPDRCHWKRLPQCGWWLRRSHTVWTKHPMASLCRRTWQVQWVHRARCTPSRLAYWLAALGCAAVIYL